MAFAVGEMPKGKRVCVVRSYFYGKAIPKDVKVSNYNMPLQKKFKPKMLVAGMTLL